jgi:hypothetical protein
VRARTFTDVLRAFCDRLRLRETLRDATDGAWSKKGPAPPLAGFKWLEALKRATAAVDGEEASAGKRHLDLSGFHPPTTGQNPLAQNP